MHAAYNSFFIIHNFQRHVRVAHLLKKENSHLLKGRIVEQLAIVYLLCRGFTPLQHNLRTGVAEVDILARKGHQLHIVEVKFRKQMAAAHLAIKPQQKQRLLRAGKLFEGYRVKNIDGIQIDALFVSLNPPFFQYLPNIYAME